MKKMKVLMVCLGNICRSPLAEGILKHKVASRGLDWEVDSAGTGSWHVGNPPDERSIAVAKKYGIDISSQRARQFRSEDLNHFDLVFAMDASNYNNIKKHATDSDQLNKLDLILNESYPGQNRTVPDPYWNDNGFEGVYELLDHACEALLDRLLSA